jgi:hypothetical protein
MVMQTTSAAKSRVRQGDRLGKAAATTRFGPEAIPAAVTAAI